MAKVIPFPDRGKINYTVVAEVLDPYFHSYSEGLKAKLVAEVARILRPYGSIPLPILSDLQLPPEVVKVILQRVIAGHEAHFDQIVDGARELMAFRFAEIKATFKE